MDYHCEFFSHEAQPVLSIRATTNAKDLPEQLGKGFMEVAQYIGELGETPAGPPFVAYYNLDTEALEVEIGFQVLKELPGKGEVEARLIPAGKYATCIYTGPYLEMAPAYDALSAWISENEFEATGVAYEYYLNSPVDTPEQELQTKIVFPLKNA